MFPHSTDKQLAGHLATFNAEARAEIESPSAFNVASYVYASLAIAAAKELHGRALARLELCK